MDWFKWIVESFILGTILYVLQYVVGLITSGYGWIGTALVIFVLGAAAYYLTTKVHI